MRLLWIMLLLPLISIGQADTTYYDVDWVKTDFSSAEYYKVIQKESDSKWRIDTRYMKNDKLKTTGYYYLPVDSAKDGAFINYDDKGNIESEGSYVKNHKIGEWKYYYEHGKELWYKEQYVDGKVSTLESYYKSGKLKRTETHSDKDVKGKCFDEDGKEIKFTAFEMMPEPSFSINKYLMKSIEYPEKAKRQNIEGRVIVRFVVNENGSISKVRAIQVIGGGCDEEAVRVMKEMPDWKPAIQDDKVVKVFFTQPIVFKLQ